MKKGITLQNMTVEGQRKRCGVDDDTFISYFIQFFFSPALQPTKGTDRLVFWMTSIQAKLSVLFKGNVLSAIGASIAFRISEINYVDLH